MLKLTWKSPLATLLMVMLCSAGAAETAGIPTPEDKKRGDSEASVIFKYNTTRPAPDSKTGEMALAKFTGHGTAFALNEKTLLTCAHNILCDETKKPYSVMWVEVYGRRFDVRPIHYNRELDIALIETDRAMNLRETLGLAVENARPGTPITVVGSLLGEPIEVFNAKVTDSYWRGFLNTKMSISNFNHGLSGSPVLSDGQVVGMVVAGIPEGADMRHDTGLYLPVTVIREFMRSTIEGEKHRGE